MCATRKRDAAKLSSLGCQTFDGEAKQAFVRRWGVGVCLRERGGSGHFLVALHWEVGSRQEGWGLWADACLLCVREDMSQRYKLTSD